MMKKFLLPFPLLAMGILPGAAQPASKHFENRAEPASAPVYLSESALPKGWPAPGPFNQVTRKEYPAYRAAFTAGSSPNGGFWTLFKHIKRNGIPMTSPVEMTMKDESGGGMKMERMGFLYQSPEVGKPGADGETVNVRDVPALSVLSYTWQGPRGDAEVAKARAAIDAVLAEKKLKAAGYRLFGYNSPSVPRKKQTYELQAVLE
jgi:hypothetical protein